MPATSTVPGSLADTDLKNNLEQVSTSKGMSVIIVNSDWTTFYVSTQGDEMMLERLKKSIFNNDIFQGISDKSSSAQQGQPDASNDGNGDVPDKQPDDMDGGDEADKNNGKKNPPEKIIDMSGNGASENKGNFISERQNIQCRRCMITVCWMIT